MDIVPFNDEYLGQAAVLLAQQQKRCRQRYPQLPARFEDPAEAGGALKAIWHGKLSVGFAAFVDNKPAAYLIGQRKVDNSFRGRSGWVYTPGCAYDDEVGVEVVRDLYAALGDSWLDAGIFNHLVLMPLGDPDLLEAWFSLGFGRQQVHGLIDLQELNPPRPDLPPGLEIRRVEKGDGPLLADLSDLIWPTTVQAPVWSMMAPEGPAEIADAWAGMVDDDEAIVWLAFWEGTAVGMQAYWPAEEDGHKLYIQEKCLYLTIAGTRAEQRGKGIGTILTQWGLSWAVENGFRYCEADWRSSSLLASSFGRDAVFVRWLIAWRGVLTNASRGQKDKKNE